MKVRKHLSNKNEQNINKEKLIQAIYDSAGIVLAIAQKIDYSVKGTYNLIHKYELEEEVRKARRIVLGSEAMHGLRVNIRKGKEASIIFALKTLMAQEGFRENIDFTTQGEKVNDVKVTIVHTTADKLNGN